MRRLWEAATGKLLDTYLTTPAAAEHAVRLHDPQHAENPLEAAPLGSCILDVAGPGSLEAAASTAGADEPAGVPLDPLGTETAGSKAWDTGPDEADRGMDGQHDGNGTGPEGAHAEIGDVAADSMELYGFDGEGEQGEEGDGEPGSRAWEDLPPAVLSLSVSPSGYDSWCCTRAVAATKSA